MNLCWVPFFLKIWEESTGESLLQIQLLSALRNFVCSLGYQSPICYDMLLPILQKGIDINNPDELNLLEDSVLVSIHPSSPFQLLIQSSCLDLSHWVWFFAALGSHTRSCTVADSSTTRFLSLFIGNYGTEL